MTHRWQVLSVTSLAVFMVFLDGAIVNVAFPALHQSFPATAPGTLSWVLNAYSIVFAALLLAAGRIADARGRRRVFFIGLGIFSAGSVLCGLAPDVLLLISARALQAVGAALLLPASMALLLPAFPLARRATAVGLWGGVGAVAAASGPTLGALIIQATSWRWVFLINVPIGLLAWLSGRRVLADARDPAATRGPDGVGTVLLTSGMGLLALGIVQGSAWGWGDPRIILSFAGAALSLAVSVWRSLTHPAPVLPLPLFRVRAFSLANSASLSFSAAFAAMLLTGVLFLNGVWHYSLVRTGLAVTPGALMAAVCAPVAGRLADRFGHRVVLVPGALLFAAAMLLFQARVGLAPAYLSVWLPAAVVSGAGVGLTLPTLGSAAVAFLPPERYGAGSAVASTARQLGSALGVAVLIALLGTPGRGDALAAFDRVWAFAAACAAAAALLCVGLGRTVRRASAPLAPSVVLEAAARGDETIVGVDATWSGRRSIPGESLRAPTILNRAEGAPPPRQMRGRRQREGGQMSDHGQGYHLGYETTKAYQAEIRGVVARERRARHAQPAQHGRSDARLTVRDADGSCIAQAAFTGHSCGGWADQAPRDGARMRFPASTMDVGTHSDRTGESDTSGQNDTEKEQDGGTWERAASRLRRSAAQQSVVLDEERLLLFDVREVMTLHHRLEATAQRRRPGDRRLHQALARLVERLWTMAGQHRFPTGGQTLTISSLWWRQRKRPHRECLRPENGQGDRRETVDSSNALAESSTRRCDHAPALPDDDNSGPITLRYPGGPVGISNGGGTGGVGS